MKMEEEVVEMLVFWMAEQGGTGNNNRVSQFAVIPLDEVPIDL